MKSRKIISMVLITTATVLLGACGASDKAGDTKVIVKQDEDKEETVNEHPEVQPEETEDSQNKERFIGATPKLPEDDTAKDTEIYRDFINGKSKLSLTFYCDNIFDEENYDTHDFSGIRDKSLTFIEFLEEFEKKAYIEISAVAYSYIDCGADGKKELALEIQSGDGEAPYENDYVVIKDIDGELQLVYMLDGECGANGWNDLNEFGYIMTSGQGIATTRYYVDALIDAEGYYKYGYSSYDGEPRLSLEQFYEIEATSMDYEKCDKLSKAADAHGVVPMFYEAKIPSVDNIMDENAKKYYCVEFYNKRDEIVDVNKIKDKDFYKNIMEEFKDIKFISKEEYDKKIADRKAAIGLTDKICSGDMPKYTEILNLQ